MATTVLLVDDSRTIRLLIRAYLVGRCYEFIEKEDGRAALGEIQRQPPSLIICDVFMPGMGGWDFVRALRNDPRREVRTLPVILSSSRREEEISRRSLELGASGFLPKPITGEHLVTLIDRLLVPAAVPKAAPPVRRSSSTAIATGSAERAEEPAPRTRDSATIPLPATRPGGRTNGGS
jgi:CheY-like chemotaxis protein